MKKVLGVAAFAVLGVVALSSCKKEFSCTCSDASGVTTETHKGKDAEDACNDATTVIPVKICVPA